MNFKIKGETTTITLSYEEILLLVAALESEALIEAEKPEPDETRAQQLADCIACFRDFAKEEYVPS